MHYCYLFSVYCLLACIILLVVGPGYGGIRPFDKECIFANYVELDKEQCRWLKDVSKDFPGIPIKHYVYKMTKSAADKKKGKMVRLNHN